MSEVIGITYGQIAFEAYKKSKQGTTYDAKPIPEWQDLGNEVRDAWDEAAKAVRKLHEHYGINDTSSIPLHLQVALDGMQTNKPNNRSEIDRRYSILITDLEKLISLFYAWIK